MGDYELEHQMALFTSRGQLNFLAAPLQKDNHPRRAAFFATTPLRAGVFIQCIRMELQSSSGDGNWMFRWMWFFYCPLFCFLRTFRLPTPLEKCPTIR
jgi:hypothetical protein